MNLVPMVIENTNKGERGYDIYSRLLKDRILLLGCEIDDDVANSMIAQMLFLDMDPTEPIHIYINSPGGSVTAGLAIYDMMRTMKSEIRTYVLGQASSMGSLLLTAGNKGQRYAMPNSRIMIHQLSVHGISGQGTDIEIAAKEIAKTKQQLNEIYAKHTGKDVNVCRDAMERDNYMSAQEAIDFGLIDKIVEQSKI